MEVRSKSIPGVEMEMTEREAGELAHILRLFSTSCKNGQQGSGTVIEEHIRFCDELNVNLLNRMGVTT